MHIVVTLEHHRKKTFLDFISSVYTFILCVKNSLKSSRTVITQEDAALYRLSTTTHMLHNVYRPKQEQRMC